jgi:hypothetical protein
LLAQAVLVETQQQYQLLALFNVGKWVVEVLEDILVLAETLAVLEQQVHRLSILELVVVEDIALLLLLLLLSVQVLVPAAASVFAVLAHLALVPRHRHLGQ